MPPTQESSKQIAFHDVLPLLEALSEDESIAVIGGQALNFWAERFPDKFKQYAPFESGNLDLLGDAVTAAECARLWRGELLLPEPFSPSPVNAVVEVKCAGKKISVQFLGGVRGLGNQDVKRLCVTVKSGKTIIKVLDAVACLESRVHNFCGLPGRNTPAHLSRIGLAIAVALDHTARLAKTNAEVALSTAERILALARGHDGLRLYVNYKLDLLDTIPREGLPRIFYKEHFNRTQVWLQERRERYASLVASISRPPPKSGPPR